MKIASQKILIVFDSQIKRASFMSWMAAEVKSDLGKVNFRKFGESDDKIVEYNDFTHAGITRRCVAVSVDALIEPLLIPIISGAKTVVFLVTRQDDSDTGYIDKLSVAHCTMLRQSPQVFVLFSDGGREQALAMESQLKTIGITPNYPELHTNDFRAIFDIAIDGDTHNVKSESGAASEVEAASVNKPTKAVKSTVLDADPKATQQSQQPQQSQAKIAPSGATASAKSKSSEKEEHALPVSATTVSKSPSTPNLGKFKMANATETLATLMAIDGAMGCFIADYSSGMVLAKAGSGVNLDVAAAGNTEVIRAKMKTMAALGLRDTIEDILITLGTQYHIIRPLAAKQGLFLYIVLDKSKSNLAMARFKLLDAEKALTV